MVKEAVQRMTSSYDHQVHIFEVIGSPNSVINKYLSGGDFWPDSGNKQRRISDKRFQPRRLNN